MKSAALIATAVALLLPCAAHAAACDALKNATYAGILRGKFDAYPNALAGISLTFDAQGVGAGRGVIAYDPDSTAAVQSYYSGVKCTSNSDGKSGLLNFGPSLGSNSFTVFDNGTRIWTKHEVPGRPIGGWLFREPPAPRLP
ncbi:MAG: hypothetical protein J7515_08485 [Caulobacter sp.]|nr:hypothetical protein [Caulobacter sp.]